MRGATLQMLLPILLLPMLLHRCCCLAALICLLHYANRKPAAALTLLPASDIYVDEFSSRVAASGFKMLMFVFRSRLLPNAHVRQKSEFRNVGGIFRSRLLTAAHAAASDVAAFTLLPARLCISSQAMLIYHPPASCIQLSSQALPGAYTSSQAALHALLYLYIDSNHSAFCK